jgi:hypothetical protein
MVLNYKADSIQTQLKTLPMTLLAQMSVDQSVGVAQFPSTHTKLLMQ